MASDTGRVVFEKALENYKPSDPKEQMFKKEMTELLKFDNCFERTLLHAHFTASAWVVDRKNRKALLTHHAKLNRWLQLGGHADGLSDMPAVAFKELIEESGSTNFRFIDKAIFDIDIHRIPERKNVPEHDHYDVRYVFEGDAKYPLKKNHESKELAWIPFADIANKVNKNESILRMLNKTLSKLI